MTSEAHLRIDEGIKRGPKNQRTSVKRRRDPDSGIVQAIPPDLDPKEILEQYLTENTTSQIAKNYGIRRKSLVAWLRKVAPEEWKAVQIVRAHDRKEKGNEEIEDANDALSLARAREMVRSAQWELTSLDEDYQPKQAISIKTEPLSQVDAELLGSAQELLKLFKARSVERVVEDVDAAPAAIEKKP
jgi:hypothetical protein